MNPTKIVIPEPCHERWAGMTPTNKSHLILRKVSL